MRAKTVVGGVLVSCLLGLVPAGGAAAGTATATAPAPALTPTGCPGPLIADPSITCAFLDVPLRHARPGSARIRLFVTRLASRTGAGAPDPVIVLQGGPGDTPDPESFVDNSLRDGREVVVLDQRGTVRSRPSLACPEVAEVLRSGLAVSSDEALERELRATAACHDRLRDEHIDLRAFDTTESAADVADLRRALGAAEVNLVGHSYGTRLALATLRDHPQGIRSVALGSAYPTEVDGNAGALPNARDAFDVLFDACAAQPACAAAHPDLRSTFTRLADDLAERPVDAETATADGPLTVRFDGDRAVSLLFSALYETTLLPILPSLVDQAAAGQFGLIAAAIPDRLPTAESFSTGLFLSTECRESTAWQDDRAVAAAARRLPRLADLDGDNARSCAIWDAGRAPRRALRPTRADTPVLFLGGAFDPVTPTRWARAASRRLPSSFVVEFPGYGHDVTAQDCARRVRQRFLADPTQRPADPCTATLGPPVFSP